MRSAELWFAHRGARELGLGGVVDNSVEHSTTVVGTGLSRGEHPQLLVPAGHWQRARPLHDQPCLVSCVVAPGFDVEDFTLA